MLVLREQHWRRWREMRDPWQSTACVPRDSELAGWQGQGQMDAVCSSSGPFATADRSYMSSLLHTGTVPTLPVAITPATDNHLRMLMKLCDWASGNEPT